MSHRNDDDDEDIEIQQFKVIVLGDGAVGKTSICVRFAEDKFSQIYKQTVGCDFFVGKLQITPKLHATLQLWDIGGQSIGSKMITNYISGADAVLLCYDITNYESFVNLEDWYHLVLKTFKDKPLPYVGLVGNKNDLRHMSAVRPEQHARFAAENDMNSFLMSAKNGDQVKHVFYKVAGTLVGALGARLADSIESQVNNTVVSAVIIDHKRHDESVNSGQVPEYTKTNKNCVVS